jgi:hypothetical protein
VSSIYLKRPFALIPQVFSVVIISYSIRYLVEVFGGSATHKLIKTQRYSEYNKRGI